MIDGIPNRPLYLYQKDIIDIIALELVHYRYSANSNLEICVPSFVKVNTGIPEWISPASPGEISLRA